MQIPVQARWAVTGIGAILVLVGAYIALTSGLNLTNDLGFALEDFAGAFIDIVVIIIGIFAMMSVWNQPPPPNVPHG